ncbi:MAG: TonB family protein [Flavobacteriales bacterium]
MEPIVLYLKVNIAFAVLYGIYALTMRKETGFNLRRAWLLAAPLAAWVIPQLLSPAAVVFAPLSIELPVMTAGSSPGMAPRTSLTDGIILLHLAISAFLLFALFIRVKRTVRALRSGTGDAGSFLGWIHVPADLPRADQATILAHEQVHAREGHSIDVLFYEVLSAICWSMPLWRLALREVRIVHEHIADRRVCDTHPDYPTLLLAHGLRTSTTTLRHSFSHSNLKTRITMLYNDRPARHTRIKLLFALPAVLLAMGLVSWRPAQPKLDPADAIVFPGVDTPAEFPGGMNALMEHLANHIHYPQQAIADAVEGTVYVVFQVKATGAVSDVKIKRGVRADLDAEAVRVVSELPDWKPAVSHGKAVSSEMILPIGFALTEK